MTYSFLKCEGYKNQKNNEEVFQTEGHKRQDNYAICDRPDHTLQGHYWDISRA